MICNNCDKEFEGKFCPYCGTKAQEETNDCPVCGKERLEESRFCANCGYDFESVGADEAGQSDNAGEVKAQVAQAVDKERKSTKAMPIIAKIYRWLIAGGMLFLGVVAMLCLTAPIGVESFLGMSSPLCSGFVALGGGDGAPTSVVNASIMLLIVSILALAYGGLQLFFAIKKPYNSVKKIHFWAIDGAICLVVLILGFVVAGAISSEQLMDAKLGAGFAMCIVMGIVGLLCLGARIFYELKLFKWKDTGMSEEQIAKAQEKKERKPIDKVKAKKIALRVGVPVLVVAVLIAIIIPSVAWANNIFRVGKVDKINIGDTQEQVVKVLGEPYEKSTYRYEYYSDNYVKLAKQIDAYYNSDFDGFDVDIDDFDEDDFEDLFDDLFEDEDKIAKMEDELEKMIYKYICVEFDSEGKVSFVFFDNEKCDSKEVQKVVKSYKLVTTSLVKYVATDIIYSTKFTDGSFYKGIVEKNYIASSDFYENFNWADEWKKDYSATITKIKQNPDILDMGNCGDNAQYVIGTDGTLTITGSGAITSALPKRKDYDRIIIAEGITSIDYFLFRNFLQSSSSTVPAVISVTIPSSVTSIRNGAFAYCGSLTSIIVDADNEFYKSDGNCLIEIETNTLILGCKNSFIPNYVTSIGIEAFEFCSSLTSIEIPSSVTSIGEYAFCECSSLTSIDIPSSVMSIGKYAFCNCSSLTSITVDADNEFYKSDGNCLIEIETNMLILGCKNSVIPDYVTSIGGFAFYGCSSLTSIDIPSSVTSIGDSAFRDCSSLTSIVIPSSVTSIGSSAFYGCSSLTSVTISSGVTSIGSSAFEGCSSLTSIYIPSSVTRIGDYAFYNCSSLTSVTISSGVTSIGSSAFSGCSSLTSVTIPSGVTSIGNYAFSGCSSLTSVTFAEGSQLTSIGSYAFRDCSSLTSIVIPSSVTSIGNYPFEGCSNLTIYCEATSRPSGWDSRWNRSGRPVVWGYKG